MNGKRGDHPLNDILDYNVPVFTDAIDTLVRQIAEYVSRERLHDMFEWFALPPPEQFEAQLRARLAALESDAEARGWEPKR